VTIDGNDDAPVIGGVASGAVSEDVGLVGGNITTAAALTVADADAGQSSFVVNTIAGSYGNLSIDATGNWSYTADNSQLAIQQLDVTESVTDTFNVSTADGTIQLVTITINGSEDAPVLNTSIGNQLTIENAAFSLSFAANTFSDSDASDTLTYSATLADNSALPAWLSFDAASRTFSGTPTQADAGFISIKVTASDGSSAVSQTFTVAVASPDPASEPGPVTPPVIDPPVIDDTDDGSEAPTVVIPELVSGSVDNVVAPPLANPDDNLAGQALFEEIEQEPAATLANDRGKFGHGLNLRDTRELLRLRALQDQFANQTTLSLYQESAEEIEAQEENELWATIDRMHKQMDEEELQNSNNSGVQVEIIVGSSITLTAGFVSWILRGGALLASMMSSVPLLNRFDPLPILKSQNDREDVTPDDDEEVDITENNQDRNVENLFSRQSTDRS
jgi:VCBS repeat-containing protein